MSTTTNAMIVGVGGQGIIRLSDLLAEVAFRAGNDVRKSEIHGLSQRGGSVHSFVRWGPEVHAPVVMEGEADFLLALEELEALRNAHYLRPGGLVILSTFRLLPSTVVNRQAEYPEGIPALLAGHGRVLAIPATDLALELGNVRAANSIMLGALSHHVDIAEPLWRAVLEDAFSPKLTKGNMRAFEIGREWASRPLAST